MSKLSKMKIGGLYRTKKLKSELSVYLGDKTFYCVRGFIVGAIAENVNTDHMEFVRICESEEIKSINLSIKNYGGKKKWLIK